MYRAGVKGTPVEDYQNTLVHDHDITFYSYGGNHQECMGHPLRYLQDSIDNEPGLQWNKQMRRLIQEMIHYRKSLGSDEAIDPNQVEKFENRYKEILMLAYEEYEYEPPGKYYKDGYNLYKRLDEYAENHLLFLHDKRIPTTNNLAEHLLRRLKRKQKQVMTFRSFESIDHLCESMGIIDLFRNREENLYKDTSSVFDRVKYSFSSRTY